MCIPTLLYLRLNLFITSQSLYKNLNCCANSKKIDIRNSLVVVAFDYEGKNRILSDMPFSQLVGVYNCYLLFQNKSFLSHSKVEIRI